MYDSDPLAGTLTDQSGGYGFATITYPSNGIQNGSPDGVALVNAADQVVQFLSYEGSFAATSGPANGITSTDIRVSEAGSEPLGQSLQLSGTGDSYSDFTWNPPRTSNFGTAPTTTTRRRRTARVRSRAPMRCRARATPARSSGRPRRCRQL